MEIKKMVETVCGVIVFTLITLPLGMGIIQNVEDFNRRVSFCLYKSYGDGPYTDEQLMDAMASVANFRG
jgi:hypothetical protein